ncbi:MAG TPA: copper chaperone PCu(A)C [Devosia sp.]|nr:copper chaperone PCu(A)C [Devosia sp.]
MNKRILAIIITLGGLIWGGIPALAQQSVVVGELELSGAFTRATPPNAKTGGGFVTITNNGEMDDQLVSVSSPAAAVVELHTMKMENEVMVMRSSPDGFAVPAGEVTELSPGGKHIMFMQITEPFRMGNLVPVTLVFERAGSVDLMLPVAPIGAKSYVPE